MAITNNNKAIFAAVIIAVIVLILDTSIIKTSILTTSESGSSQRVQSFVIILSITIAIQYLILRFVKDKSETIRRISELHINMIHKIVTMIQYVLTGVLVFVVLQITLTSEYSINLLITAVTISYGLSVAMTVLLTQRFFSWFKSNRDSVVLFYGLASVMVVINALIALFFVDITLFYDLPEEIVSHLGENIPFFAPSSLESFLNSTYDILSIMSFMAMWGATSLLLRHYTKRLGTVRYWIFLSIPLVFFLSQFLTLYLNLFASLLSSQAIFYGVVLTLVFTFSKPAGGILFGIAFWIIARNVQHSSLIVRDYMIISAYGLVLLFASNQASILITAPYPPFGLATASFMGLSSYFVLVGIYSSAISVSNDIKLRKSIRRLAIKESKLLDSIGTAHMEHELEKRVISFTKQNQNSIVEQTGIYSSITEEDIKQYVDQAIRETRKPK